MSTKPASEVQTGDVITLTTDVHHSMRHTPLLVTRVTVRDHISGTPGDWRIIHVATITPQLYGQRGGYTIALADEPITIEDQP